VSNNIPGPSRWLDELPEPDAFSPEEFHAWRGLIRLREAVMREIDHRLRQDGALSLADYGVLITLVTAPGLRLRMSSLGAQRMLTPSGITRVIIRLEERGLVQREPDPADGRAAFAVLTRPGLAALRQAQVIHHATVRELYLGRLTQHELQRLARLFEKALPGVVSAPVWPPPPTIGAEP
jgi:DNA-binding MarR family transcriptional regulator